MNNIFCDEPIIAVYEGSRKFNDIKGANAWLDAFSELAYHVTEGNRIVLETEGYYISLSYNGVTKTKKLCSVKDFEQDGEWLEPYIHTLDEGDPTFVEYESTLFVGERLLDILEADGYFLLTFDDFKLKIIPHELNKKDFPSLDELHIKSYYPVLGAERHIKRKCSCGGEGELLLDFVSDFVVRCKDCKRSTYAEMIAKEAIRKWNNGKTPCDLSDATVIKP